MERALWKLTLKLWLLNGSDPGKLHTAHELMAKLEGLREQYEEVARQLEELIDSM